MAVELANAYVTLIPSATGIVAGIAKEMGAPLEEAAATAGEKTSKSFGEHFKSGMETAVKLAAVALGAGVAAGVGLEKIGATFEEANKKIRVTTGATGADLVGLNESFKHVVSTVPADFGQASTAIAVFNQKLGLGGPGLESLAAQVIRLSRLTGTDLTANVQATANLFNSWGTAAADQGPKLDELFRISQKTGISVSDLATQMTDGGVQFRQVGLTFESTGALLGLLARNGLSASDVIPALSKSMAKAAKDGKDANTVFQDTFTAIRNAPNDTAAAGIALDVFGARAGPKFAALIREGKLSYEELSATIAAGGDTIAQAAKDTSTWHGKLKLLTNQALVALEPIATKVFESVGNAVAYATPYVKLFITWAGEKLQAALAAVSGWVQANWPQIQTIVVGVFDVIRTAISYFTDTILPALVTGFQSSIGWLMDNKEVLIGVAVAIGTLLVAAFVSWAVAAGAAAVATIAAAAPFIAIGLAIAAVVGGVIYAYNHFEIFRTVVNAVKDFITDKLVPAFQVVWGVIVNDVVPALQATWSFIQDKIIPIISTLVETYIKVLVAEFQAVSWVVTNVVIPGLQLMWGYVRDKVIPVFEAVISTVATVASAVGTHIGAIVGFVGALPGRIGGVFSTLWDGLKTGIETARQWVADKIDAVVGFASALPGRMAGIFGGMWDGIKEAFRSAINFIIRGWNSLHFGIPEFDTHIPGVGKIGGGSVGTPHINEIHTGGIIPGASDYPAVLLGGEMVLTAAQQAQLFDLANGSGGSGLPPITVYNNGRDFTVADMNHVLATARLAS